MKDIVVDLRSARRRMESTSGATTAVAAGVATPSSANRPASTTSTTRSMGTVAIVGVAAAVILVAALWFWRPWEQSGSRPDTGNDKPAVAVLYFENQTGDPSLDWMRTGLTDMMVTDSRSRPTTRCSAPIRVVQILQDLNRADDKVISSDVVQQIADRAGVDRVLVGSFVKMGDTIRINARLQEAESGKIVTAERVEGVGESGFSRRRRAYGASKPRCRPRASGPTGLERPGDKPEVGLDRGVTDITTSSIEAYRYYAEGINLHERFLEAQAVPPLEKAVEIDPNFAMALAKLAVVTSNLGLSDQGDEYSKRALDNSERLTPRERYYIEGFYYSRRPETREKAIEAYRQGLALHPEHQASRHNLASQLSALERFDEAAAEYEELRRRGTSNPTTYGNLAGIYAQAGDTARARQVLQEYLVSHRRTAPRIANSARCWSSTAASTRRRPRSTRRWRSTRAISSLESPSSCWP
jgi:TolB-like protein/Tfp pilus assembly protein PilF